MFKDDLTREAWLANQHAKWAGLGVVLMTISTQQLSSSTSPGVWIVVAVLSLPIVLDWRKTGEA